MSSSDSEDSVEKQVKKFSWTNHQQTLKDVVLQHRLFAPNADQYREIATILNDKYKIRGVDAEKVRSKFKTKTFSKWLETQQGKKEKKSKITCNSSSKNSSKKRKRSDSEDSRHSDDDNFIATEDGEEESDDAPKLSKDVMLASIDNQSWKPNWNQFPETFKMCQPLILSSSTNYYILYRTDLASQVTTHIKVLPDPLLMLEIKIDPIYTAEMSLTEAWKDREVAMPRNASIFKLVPVALPSDALLGSSSLTRRDYDTEFGRLVELIIPRFKSSFSLGPPQQQIKQQQRAETISPLHRPFEKPAESK